MHLGLAHKLELANSNLCSLCVRVDSRTKSRPRAQMAQPAAPISARRCAFLGESVHRRTELCAHRFARRRKDKRDAFLLQPKSSSTQHNAKFAFKLHGHFVCWPSNFVVSVLCVCVFIFIASTFSLHSKFEIRLRFCAIDFAFCVTMNNSWPHNFICLCLRV